MHTKSRYRIAVFFTILFVALISAPTIILSFDDSVDVSNFYSINEEEENENLKLVLKDTKDDLDGFLLRTTSVRHIGYTFKTYPKPHLNLISPPPEFIS